LRPHAPSRILLPTGDLRTSGTPVAVSALLTPRVRAQAVRAQGGIVGVSCWPWPLAKDNTMVEQESATGPAPREDVAAPAACLQIVCAWCQQHIVWRQAQTPMVFPISSRLCAGCYDDVAQGLAPLAPPPRARLPHRRA